MTHPYRLTPRARDGFRRIAFYLEENFGEAVAERVIEELEKAFELLADNPSVGHRRDDLTDDLRVRFWPVGPTLIAYRSNPEWLEVLFVERGDLDWERLLAERVE